MQSKDQTPRPDRAATTPAPAAQAEGAREALARDDAEPPATPRAPRAAGRAMQVLATPIISVAISPKTNAPERAESEEDASSSGVHVSAPPGGLLGLSSGMRPMAGPGAFGSFPKPEKRRQLAYAHFDDGANEVRTELHRHAETDEIKHHAYHHAHRRARTDGKHHVVSGD